MPAYIAFLIDIHQRDGFSEYARAAAPTYAEHRGRIALRGPIVQVVEGALDVKDDTRLVVLEFESLEDAQGWWDSEQYRRAAKLREPPIADTRAFFVEGVNLGT
jgi:uncharacterized protein (DUF1330 family)